jgi:cellulose synthase/poly-beta-1,6-N-acetylglucosamine synthase-like glycosyltransferase
MSVTSLRPLHRQSARPIGGAAAFKHLHPAPNESEMFGVALLRAGRITAPFLMQALRQPEIAFVDHLFSQGIMAQDAAYTALAAHWAVGLADFNRHAVDPALVAQVDSAACLAGHWIPWRKMGQSVVIACAYPEDFADLRPILARQFGEVVLAIAPRAAIDAQIMLRAGAAMARRAETLLPEGDSCRTFVPRRAALPLALVVGVVATGAALYPILTATCLIGFALMLAYVQTFLKLVAAAMTLRPKLAQISALPAAPFHLVPKDSELPTISIMVPLYRESRIVARLIRRLDHLDYPRSAMDVILLTESHDDATARALGSIALPPWVRVLTVPPGTIRTKPRALNFGLDHCKGQIIGVYDAEDAPELDQLRQVAQAFAKGGARLACLQGRLDYYNPHHNWLSRCFTIDYANWWRVVLPGFSRMGFAIPLGGTTLFFRREALMDLGGWDAHNVTEDADLGLRLVRRGYETQLLDSTTFEEANCRPLPWIKQRSRWIKGYIMTYASHMRSPRALLRDLGLWRFFGMQMMFAGSVLQALLAPLLPVLWLASFGLIDLGALGVPTLLQQFIAFGLVAEALMYAVAYLGMRRTQHSLSPLWLPLMMVYHMMSSLAALKAVYEVLTKPFYWDKTAHGLFDG